jgi:hypothetical protein
MKELIFAACFLTVYGTIAAAAMSAVVFCVCLLITLSP